jgi:hypothetical protein
LGGLHQELYVIFYSNYKEWTNKKEVFKVLQERISMGFIQKVVCGNL